MRKRNSATLLFYFLLCTANSAGDASQGRSDRVVRRACLPQAGTTARRSDGAPGGGIPGGARGPFQSCLLFSAEPCGAGVYPPRLSSRGSLSAAACPQRRTGAARDLLFCLAREATKKQIARANALEMTRSQATADGKPSLADKPRRWQGENVRATNCGRRCGSPARIAATRCIRISPPRATSFHVAAIIPKDYRR